MRKNLDVFGMSPSVESAGRRFAVRVTHAPRKTRFSRRARIGQTLLDGLVTRRVPMRGFRVLCTSHPPFPSLPGALGSTEARESGTHEVAGSAGSMRILRVLA
jgi:hypothetical protein